jgi:antitoxin (DNA-binding transcriptional repressor) of toxin-antitoxin stability system
MPVTASELRANIYKILDSALETGLPVEVERKGKILRIIPVGEPSKLSRLPRRSDFIRGEAGDLVHMDWSSEWKP